MEGFRGFDILQDQNGLNKFEKLQPYPIIKYRKLSNMNI